MERQSLPLLFGLVMLLLAPACGRKPVDVVIQTHVVTVVHTQEVTVVVLATPEGKEVLPGNGVLPQIEQTPIVPSKDWIASEEAKTHVGETVKVRIEQADCTYQPSMNGSPTFCNDAPYPGHTFTLVVWRQDWSDLDGSCLIVSGEVTEYSGLPQIEALSREQVVPCSP